MESSEINPKKLIKFKGSGRVVSPAVLKSPFPSMSTIPENKILRVQTTGTVKKT